MSLSLAVSAGAAFADGDQISDEYAVAVEFAAQTGILEGVGNNNYAPQENLTRAQLATMTYRIATGDVEDDYTANFVGGATTFTDTSATAWYAGYVGYAADAGYLKGMGDGTYAPNAALTGYQTLAAFLRAIGYNEAGHNFCGADWTVQVAKVAKETGALEGIVGVDLNKAISREVAAQMLYNILFSENVKYTLAFGYNGNDETLAKDVFDIKTDKDGDIKATAPWGQPATQWFYENGKKDDTVAVSIAYEPVAEYTAAVEECDLADDLGLGAKDGDVAKWYENGKEITKFSNKDDSVINMKHKSTIGAQGTLTEVYEVEGDYWFVQIETWLGKITKTYDAKVDANGHEYKAAQADLDVFTGKDCVNLDTTIETADFAKNDYVLVNYSWMYDKENKADYGYYLTETAPVATAKVTNIDRANQQTTIGGTVYDWSKHYHLGADAITTTYDVFVDFYGNLIGLVKPADPDPVYTILEGGWYDSSAYDSYVAGRIVNLTTGDLEPIEIDSYDKVSFWSDRFETKVHDIVEYEVTEDGYEMTKAGVEYDKGYNIVNGEATMKIFGGRDHRDVFATADANTVYAIERECGEYEIVTGYEDVPSMYSHNGEIEVLDEDKDGFADLVYVDATSAIFAEEEVIAFVLPWTDDVGGGELENGVEYDLVSNVVIGGEIVKVMVKHGDAEKLFNRHAIGPCVLTVDENGLVIDVDDYDMMKKDVAAVAEDGKTVVLGNTGYTVTEDTEIWVIDVKHGSVEAAEGTFADFEENDEVFFEVETGKVLDLVIIVK